MPGKSTGSVDSALPVTVRIGEIKLFAADDHPWFRLAKNRGLQPVSARQRHVYKRPATAAVTTKAAGYPDQSRADTSSVLSIRLGSKRYTVQNLNRKFKSIKNSNPSFSSSVLLVHTQSERNADCE